MSEPTWAKSTMEYSKKELEMFTLLDYEDLCYKTNLYPPSVYQIVAEACFIKDLQGLAVDSLRRCMEAFKKSEVWRMTPEWDALIELK